MYGILFIDFITLINIWVYHFFLITPNSWGHFFLSLPFWSTVAVNGVMITLEMVVVFSLFYTNNLVCIGNFEVIVECLVAHILWSAWQQTKSFQLKVLYDYVSAAPQLAVVVPDGMDYTFIQTNYTEVFSFLRRVVTFCYWAM